MIGQPKNYDEMLKRIFWSTFIIGLLCTLSLGYKSPEINKLLKLSTKEWDLGPVALPLVSVLIPSIIAILARWLTLHDLISDVFHIRERFDIKHVLLKLAEGVNFKIDEATEKKIKEERNNLMRATFYKYAENADKAVINSQLVSNALDRWCWFWCFLEPTVIILLSASIAWWLVNLKFALFYIPFFVLFVLFSFLTYPSCKKAVKNEVDDILSDENRKNEISKIFNAL